MPTSKTYKVVGTAPILNHEPGETFTAEIPEGQERFLIGIGGLAVVWPEKPQGPKVTDLAPAPIGAIGPPPRPQRSRRDAERE